MFAAFLRAMGLTTGIAWGCLALPLYVLGEPTVLWGVVVGWLVAAFCFTAGFYTVCRTFHRSPRALMISIFGGMLARLVVIGVVMVLLLRLTDLSMVSLLSSLLGFYVLYLIVELYFVHTRLQSRKEPYS
jgi:hypothetical protein